MNCDSDPTVEGIKGSHTPWIDVKSLVAPAPPISMLPVSLSKKNKQYPRTPSTLKSGVRGRASTHHPRTGGNLLFLLRYYMYGRSRKQRRHGTDKYSARVGVCELIRALLLDAQIEDLLGDKTRIGDAGVLISLVFLSPELTSPANSHKGDT